MQVKTMICINFEEMKKDRDVKENERKGNSVEKEMKKVNIIRKQK